MKILKFHKHKNWFRLITLILIATILCQNLSFANEGENIKCLAARSLLKLFETKWKTLQEALDTQDRLFTLRKMILDGNLSEGELRARDQQVANKEFINSIQFSYQIEKIQGYQDAYIMSDNHIYEDRYGNKQVVLFYPKDNIPWKILEQYGVESDEDKDCARRGFWIYGDKIDNIETYRDRDLNLLTKDPEEIQQMFEKMTGQDAIEFLNFIAKRYPGAKTIKFRGHTILRIPSKLYPNLAVYLLPEELRKEYVIGFHATSNIRTGKIVKNGFVEGGPGHNNVYFAVGLNKENNVRHPLYGKRRVFCDASYIIDNLFKSPRKAEASQSVDVLESELAILENRVRDKQIGLVRLLISGFITPDLVERYGIQFIEALVPIDKTIDHTNGCVRDGKFYGYEAKLSGLAQEYVLHVSEKITIREWEGLFPLTIRELLSLYDETPDPFSKAMNYGQLQEFARKSSTTATDLVNYIKMTGLYIHIRVIREALKDDPGKLAEFNRQIVLVEKGPPELGIKVVDASPETFLQLESELINTAQKFTTMEKTDLRKALSVAKRINPSMKIDLSEAQLQEASPEIYGIFVKLLIREIFIPANKLFVLNMISESSPTIYKGNITTNTWERHDYLGVAVWTADIVWDEVPLSSIGHTVMQYAFVDSSKARQLAFEIYDSIMSQSQDTLSALDREFVSYLKRRRIDREGFSRHIVIERFRQHELRHAKDNMFASLLSKKSISEIDVIKCAEDILKPESGLRFDNETDPYVRKMRALLVVEISGWLGGIIGEIELHLEHNHWDSAYAAFLDFYSALQRAAETPEGTQVDINSYVAKAILSGFTEQNIKSEQDIISFARRSNVHPAQSILTVLKTIYAGEYYLDEERADILNTRSKDTEQLQVAHPVEDEILHTDSELAESGLITLQQIFETLPSVLANKILNSKSYILLLSVFTGVCPERRIFLPNEMDIAEKEEFFRKIRLNHNLLVIDNGKGTYSVVNIEAASRIIKSNSDLFPQAACQNTRDWLKDNLWEWYFWGNPKTLISDKETISIRYGLLSGYTRDASGKFVAYHRIRLRMNSVMFSLATDEEEFFEKHSGVGTRKSDEVKERLTGIIKNRVGSRFTNEEISIFVDAYGSDSFIFSGCCIFDDSDALRIKRLEDILHKALRMEHLEKLLLTYLKHKLLSLAKQEFELTIGGSGMGIPRFREMKGDRKYMYLQTKNISIDDLPSNYPLAMRTPDEYKPAPGYINVNLPDVDVFLVSQSHSGSRGVVRLGWLDDGTPVAIKARYTYSDEQDNEQINRDYQEALVLDRLGIGPRLHGLFKDEFGRISIIMDIVPGDFPGQMKEFITIDAVRDLREVNRRLVSRGKSMDFDCQYLITSSGRIQIIDAEDINRSAPNDYHFFVKQLIRLLTDAKDDIQKQALEEIAKEEPTLLELISKELEVSIELYILINGAEPIERIALKGKVVETRKKLAIQKDIEFAIGLMKYFRDGTMYELRYNAKRLSQSQKDLIEEYCVRLNERFSGTKIKVIPVMNAEEDYIIKVIHKDMNRSKLGEGCINIAGEDELGGYPLRIIGMLNIAFAAANVPVRLTSDQVEEYRPLISFIQDQYKSITGGELTLPDSVEEMLMVIRKIELPKPEKIHLDEANRLNRIARQLLTSA